MNRMVKKLDQEELENNLDYQEMKTQIEKNNKVDTLLLHQNQNNTTKNKNLVVNSETLNINDTQVTETL
jgi:hypothetical protein